MAKITHYLILGFGVTGQSVLDFILKQSCKSSEEVIVITIYDQKYHSDSDSDSDLNKNIKINFCQDLADYKKIVEKFAKPIDLVISSPGINPKIFKPVFDTDRKFQAPIISDIQLFIDYVNKEASSILAVTGTNGKSTVCELATYLIKNLLKILLKNKNTDNKVMLGGNFGIPVLGLLDLDNPSTSSISSLSSRATTNYVLELSSFQLALTDYLPCLAAVCLNISPDHLYWHGDMATYTADKLKIYQDSKFDIINLDQPLIVDYYKNTILPEKIANKKAVSLILYSTQNEINHQQYSGIFPGARILAVLAAENGAICLNSQQIFDLAKLPESLKSEHNISNLLAVIGLLWSVISYSGDNTEILNLTHCLEDIKEFKGLPYRCELIANDNNIAVYNDSKATNLDACITAIKSVKKLSSGRIWLILGGITKEDLDDPASRKLFQQSLDNKIGGVIIFGNERSSKQKLFELLPAGSNSLVLNSTDAESGLEEVVSEVYKLASPNDAILFSPAAASFDMFNNYMHRGELFTAAILKYLKYSRTL